MRPTEHNSLVLAGHRYRDVSVARGAVIQAAAAVCSLISAQIYETSTIEVTITALEPNEFLTRRHNTSG